MARWRSQSSSASLSGAWRMSCSVSLATRLARALPQGEQVQVVVAQQALRGVAQRREAAQHLERAGAAVDKVAQDIERVAARRESDLVEQALKRCVATLQVADTVK
jgi:hypothetical protein